LAGSQGYTELLGEGLGSPTFNNLKRIQLSNNNLKKVNLKNLSEHLP
jgi:hypothetical protein